MDDLHFIPDEVAPIRPRKYLVAKLMVAVLILGGLAGLFSRAVWSAREAARASQCLCNLCMIKLALHNYHEAFGSFPPAYVADAAGRPMHSWRVLILPYMELSSLYQAYDMAEPWDGPNNRKLLGQRPSTYQCPSRKDGPTLTSYVAIVGPGTAFPGAGTTKLGDIHDGPANQILVAEASNVDIAWTEPRDLDVRTMSWTIDDRDHPGISSPHPGGPAVVFADATYRRLSTYHPPEAIKAMTTIDGHEPAAMPEKPH